MQTIIEFVKAIFPYWMGLSVIVTVILCAFMKFSKPSKFEQ